MTALAQIHCHSCSLLGERLLAPIGESCHCPRILLSLWHQRSVHQELSVWQLIIYPSETLCEEPRKSSVGPAPGMLWIEEGSIWLLTFLYGLNFELGPSEIYCSVCERGFNSLFSTSELILCRTSMIMEWSQMHLTKSNWDGFMH